MRNSRIWCSARRLLICLCVLAAVPVSFYAKVEAAVKLIQIPTPSTVRLLITDRGFEPDHLQLKLGRPIRLDIRNLSAARHTFVMPGYNVYSCILQRGDAVFIELVPDKPGEFEFYSDGSRPSVEPRGKISVR